MIFFSSDHHFYHNNIIRYCDRPFSSVEEMNESMIVSWNAVVSPDDTVFYLGDFSMAFRPVETITPRLNGRKILIPGNHDFCHSSHKKSRNIDDQIKWIKKYNDCGWEVSKEYVDEFNNGPFYRMCHLPYAEDGDVFGTKYDKYRPVDMYQGVLLCGHVHEKWKTKESSLGSLMINVGVDVNNFTPISSDQIDAIIVEHFGWEYL